MLKITALGYALLSAAAFAQQAVHHDMQVTLHPTAKTIEVEDKITLPQNHPALPRPVFVLHAGLQPVATSPGAHITRLQEGAAGEHFGINISTTATSGRVQLEYYRVTLPPDSRKFTVRYAGKIYHPIKQGSEEYARSFSETPGTISEQGVFLASASYWYPWFNKQLVSFRLHVALPAGWDAVSQGERRRREKTGAGTQAVWDSPEPQDDLYLVAGRFVEYSRAAGAVQAMAFLRSRDDALANKYLETTAQYLEMYRQLIGPYPYKKFALVENFWETGYGMPSFTLLGPKIIRFPFILHSSYPHEILHNWWGNSVFVDYESGNWCEGLTAYLADHLIQEQRGAGVNYRRSTLQKYTDYVKAGKDFPLTEFRARHSSATEAVGYGKTLMLFHMLRLQLGEAKFTRALQQFYRKFAFKKAAFADVQAVFSSVAGRPLEAEFAQWVERTGAPELRIQKTSVTKTPGVYRLALTLEQGQPGEPYRLHIPVAVQLEGRAAAHQAVLEMDSRVQDFALDLPARPIELQVDPEFDVFRRLHREEIPPALSQLFGASEVTILLPANAPAPLLAGFRKLAQTWIQSESDRLQIRTDAEMAALPADRAVWVFGRQNKFYPALSAGLQSYGVAVTSDQMKIGRSGLDLSAHSAIWTARNPRNPNFTVALLTTGNVAAMPGLARKLPHYGKYSYLGFDGDEPTNIVKGQWPAVNSPLSRRLVPAEKPAADLPPAKLMPRQPLASLPPVFSETRMRQDIAYLASDELQGRGFGAEGLRKAAQYIESEFRKAGLHPGGAMPGSYYQVWTERGGEPEQESRLLNVVGILPGRKKEFAGQSVVVGAHYDHLGLGWPDVRAGEEGKIHPGADDNASGVAVLLELARVLGSKWQPDRSVLFVAFAGEEAGLRGSKHYVETADRFPASQCIGMLNLDTVGRLGKNKLTIFGTGSASEWVHIFRGAGFVTGVEVESIADDFGSSDQKSFLDAGVPAVQFFSGVHLDYHRPSDTADKIDGAGLVKVAAVLKEGVEYLAGRPEPMHVTLAKRNSLASKSAAQPRPGRRRVSLGSVPDFAFSGPGVRITGTVPGSPAAKAGLQEGDIITQIDGEKIADLRGLSGVLAKHSPGDEITLIYLRAGRAQRAQATLVAR